MNVTPQLHFAFDVGHSSIGWAVLEVSIAQAPQILGCGAVIFPADDCLASQRRLYRRQRRHVRATRLRIARLRRLLAHLGVLTEAQLEAPGCAWPWLLAARVLRGGAKLTWAELWDVLRWYAHNRGYDGNKGWSRDGRAMDEMDQAELDRLATDTQLSEEERKDAKYLKQAKSLMGKYRTGSMAETWCAVCGLEPLGDKRSCNLGSSDRPRGLRAAFPRRVVEREVERILRAHLGGLPRVDEALLRAILTDYTAITGPDYRLPARYGQRLADGSRSAGGLLFGQLVPRFENRIIARCPLTYQRVYEAELAASGDAERAAHEAEKQAKVPAAECPEFYHYRWAMQLANVVITCGPGKETRRLSAAERQQLHATMQAAGAMTPPEFRKAVRALTGDAKDNLGQMLALPDADRALVLDPARKFARSGALGVIFPHLEEKARRHLLTNLRRGKAVTVRRLLAAAPAAAQAAFDRWWDGEAMRKPRKGQTPRTRDQILDEPHALKPDTGRAPFSRAVLREVCDFVLRTDRHPADGTEGAADNGPLFRSEAIRRAQLQRAIDEQTNNHLVRHRLKLLERLHEDLIKEYAGGDRTRIARIAIEVNRDLKEMSGKDAVKRGEEQRAQTRNFRDVEKYLHERLDGATFNGRPVQITAGLIRKARVASDLGWTCPYTGRTFGPMELVTGAMDKDHIIPRSQRPSDSLDSLVITPSQINKIKDARTGLEFVRWLNQPENLKQRDELGVWTVPQYEAFVKGLDTKGHDDDARRKKNRKRLLLLESYVEKEFTPGDLTRTSQLVRLGAQALQRAYLVAAVYDRRTSPEKAAPNPAQPPATAPQPPAFDGHRPPLQPASAPLQPARPEHQPVITSLPGSVTGAVRKSWNLLGCLVPANPLVLNPDELDEDGKPKVHRKTEIRGITHLHHALDACVLGLISHILPLDGATWNREVIEALAKRRVSPHEEAILRRFLGKHIEISADKAPRIKELENAVRQQLCDRLAERRVVQHLPRDLSGLESKATVWRVFDPTDPHRNARRLARWLDEASRADGKDAKTLAAWLAKATDPKTTTALIIGRKRKNADAAEGESAGGKVFHEGKTWRWVYDIKDKTALLGLDPEGDPAKAKLKKLKAVKVLGDNFGLALDPQPQIIRAHKVWHQLARLREANGGKAPRVLRNGMLIQIPRGSFAGVWRVRSIKNDRSKGELIDMAVPDAVTVQSRGPAQRRDVRVRTLLRDGLAIVGSGLCGVAAEPKAIAD